MNSIRQPLYGAAAAQVREQLAATPAPAVRMREATAPTGHPHPLLDDTAREHPDVRQFIDGVPADTRITYEAGAIYVACKIYDEALATSSPAETLDDIADAIPEIMPGIFKDMGTAPDLAAVLLPSVTDRIWAFTVVEYARVEAGDGYGYLFDLLAESLRKGADPHVIRRDALAAPKRLRELAEQAGGDE